MNEITEKLLAMITDWKGSFEGAFNIRQDGQCVGRQESPNVTFESCENGDRLTIRIHSQTQGETVYIPACVTKSGVSDVVYNDFYIADGADVIIVAGCGVHSEGESEALHKGIHRFFVGKDAHVLYQEKHIGTGKSKGVKRIDPVTEIVLEENAVMEIDTSQISGVDYSNRTTKAVLAQRAKLNIYERLMTTGSEIANTDFSVDMNGDNSCVDLISRSVAKDQSKQDYHSVIRGNARCAGHSECDAILAGNGIVNAAPELLAANIDAALIHEAAIGKIAGEQIIKLMTLGMTEKEAEEQIIGGFLK